ncbi:sigma-70 family RNA polymerase sigma factor [Clostridium beijerinckii]|uniref:DNA-directed RNA polymerase specialized sigma subunit n=1 Tax=Clostridium beijerinckii TaxID=1520 RepID=A0AAX0B196_CLOBE|nr:sigma-70 family RNA polymerase sigma factor [Clostridium beijerinckii]NRT88722.1 DNA-directed RNA polymerase specialized sigma subunit [Clostridium beijerinckii]NYC74177.1 DNA-directed RNA polymerase specialized sigma subunit [Clostridium beijerinckii]
MDHKDIFEQTKKDLKEFKAIIARLKTNKLILEKDTLLSDEEKKLLERKIKSDEIKLEKIKAALEFLSDTDLKIITSIFFEKVTNKDMAAQLNVSKEFINRHKRESTERIADIMYGHLVGSNLGLSYLQD